MSYPFIKFSSVALVGALLAGCATPGNVAPHAQAIDPGRIDAGAVISAAPLGGDVDAHWWTLYGDTQLDALVERAVAGNPSLRIAADRVAQAQALVGAAQAARGPSVQGSAEFERAHFSEVGETPPPLAGGESWDNNIAARLSFNLDLWGRNRAALEAAVGSVRAAQLDARQSQIALQTAVVRAYLQLAYAHAVRDVLDATVAQRQQMLDLTRRRHDAGLAPQLQVSQALAEVAPVRLRLEQADNRIQLLRNQLAALSGQGPGAGDAITRPQPRLGLAASLPSVVPADLIGRRPDVVAARWRIEAAGQDIAVARAEFYPNVNLTAFAGLQSLTFQHLLETDAATFGAGPAITLPLFDSGRLRANLAGRTAAYDLAIDQYNQTVIGAMREVADVIATVQSTARQHQRADESLAAAHRAFDEAQTGFDAGLTDFLTVLTTQTSLLTQQQAVAQAVSDELDARARLMQALGGGFRDDGDSAAQLEHTLAAHTPARSDSETAQ